MLSRLPLLLSIFLVFAASPCEAQPSTTDAEEEPHHRGVRQNRNDIYGDPLPEGAVARLGTNRLRKDKRTVSVAYCPDGKLIASADDTGTVRVWNADTGNEFALVHSAVYPQFTLAQRVLFSPDGRYLTYIAKGGLHLWDRATKRSSLLAVDLGPRAFSPDGNLLAGGRFREFVVFDFKERIVRFRLAEPKEWIRAVVFSPNGKLVATADGRPPFGQFPTIIRLWDVGAGKQVAEWDAHQRFIESLSFSPDGKVLASGGHGSICLWDVASHRQLASLDAEGSLVSYSPDGKLLAAAGSSSTVQLWDPVKHEKVRSIPTGNGWVSALAYSPDGKQLLTGGLHHALNLWDVATGKEVLRREGHRVDLHSVEFSPNGKTLASRSGDQSILLWNLATSKIRQRFSLAEDGRTDLWLSASPSSLAYAPDGKSIAAAAGGYDNTVFVWDVTSGQKKLRIHTPKRPPSSIAFSPDGQALATGEGGTVRLWSTSSGAALHSSPLDGISPVAFSPDGRILATGARGALARLWSWRTGRSLRDYPSQPLGHIPHEREQASGLAFSFDGQLLATCGGAYQRKDSRIHLWETATGKCYRTMRNMEMSFLCVALSPDGHLLASGGDGDSAVHIWDVLTGKKVGQFSGHRGNIYCVAFSPDGKTLASGSADTTILLWDVSSLLPKPSSPNPDSNELTRLWSELKEGVATAYPALWKLTGAREKSVAFFGEHLPPTSAPDAKHISQLIADLDSDDFGKREAATAQLKKLGELAEPALRETLQGKPTIETRKRIEQILAEITERPLTPDELRQIRALHALELIGSPAACALLKKLAAGAPGARLTRDAKLALQRLERRNKTP